MSIEKLCCNFMMINCSVLNEVLDKLRIVEQKLSHLDQAFNNTEFKHANKNDKVIIFGIGENFNTKMDYDYFSLNNIFTILNCDTNLIARHYRIGKKNIYRSNPRPVVVEMRSKESCKYIVHKSRATRIPNIFVNQFLSKKQRRKGKKLWLKCKRR